MDRGAERRTALRGSDEDRSGVERVQRPPARLRREILMNQEQLASYIRDIPDFPKPGIIFKDITPLLRSAEALGEACKLLSEPFRDSGITAVAAIESRGFIFGSVVRANLRARTLPQKERRERYG